MNYVVRSEFNVLWVIMDRLTRLTHFIPIKDNANPN